jgi:hypothetical protein
MCTDDLDVARVHVRQHRCGIALEDVGVEIERGLSGVPAARREARPEIDDSINWNLLGSKCVDDSEQLGFVLERAVRLHVPEGPLRWKNRRSRDL